MRKNLLRLRDVEIIVANMKRRYSGVTSTVAALLPVQSQKFPVAALGPKLPEAWPKVTFLSLLTQGWSRPQGKPGRIFHARRNNEMLFAWLLRDFLRQPLKIVFTSAAQRDHSAWTKFLIRRMDAVIATSPESAAYLKVPHVVNLHGINTRVYRPSVNREAEWAESKLSGKYAVGVFGRVRAQKGVDRFVELMLELLPKHPDFTAVIVGAIKMEERGFADQLQEKIKAAGLERRIVFLGEVPASEVPVWLRRMAIVVCPQRWEGFGLVSAEAMASGAAVVATRVGAAMHVIREGETGFLCDADDMKLMESRLDFLMANPEVASQFGENGRRHVEAAFSIEREAAGIESVYRKLFDSWR